MKNIEIYCVTNKPIKFLENFNYKLCAVGKNNFSKKYLRCDTGNNIYNKEKHYSELTFHYWYWKNKLDVNNKNWIGFCQRRRFWINKESVNKKITLNNFHEHLLQSVPSEWNSYEAILCSPIKVNQVKISKLLKRGIKSVIKKPSLLIDNNKRNIKLHFDMHHGHGNLNKAIEVMNKIDRYDFEKFVNNSTEFNPHIIFISKSKIANKWFKNLYDWLFKCEKIFGFKDLHGYDTNRLYAYLAERYLSFWFNKYTKVLNWPWIIFDPEKED